MKRIDAHQHFWHYSASEYDWIDDSMAVLKRDFLPEHLAVELKTQQIDGSVVVQARQSLEETRWLLELANKHDSIQGVVGWIDLCSEDLEQQLKQFKEQNKLKGFRHVLQAEDDAYMLQPEFIRGVTRLADHGYSFDILITASQLVSACKLVNQLPVMKLVIDHIAKPNIAEQQWDDWQAHMTEISAHQHVFCKLSGMVTEANWSSWKPADIQPYITEVLSLFGSKRTMYGSDWPVCQVAGSYSVVLGLIEDSLKHFSDVEQAQVLGQTANDFYQLEQTR